MDPTLAAKNLGQGSRFEELLQQLRQEHSRVVKQILEEATASAPGRAVPRQTSSAWPGISDAFERPDAIAVSLPPRPDSPAMRSPADLPRRSWPRKSFSRLTLDSETVSTENSGRLVGAGGREPWDPEVMLVEEILPEVPAMEGLDAQFDDGHDLARHSSANSMDAANAVKHVRRMLTRSGTMATFRSDDGDRVSRFSSLSSKVRRFLRFFEQPQEEAELFSGVNRPEGSHHFYLFKKVVTSATFEFVFALLIMVNTLVLMFQAQYEGMQSGFESDLGRMETPASEVWPGASQVFDTFDIAFGILFTTELVIRTCAVQHEFLKDPWNAIDFVIVVSWLIERAAKTFLPVDTKIIRIARLGRLLRFLRIVKTMQAFDSLYLIIASIKSSFAALAWSSVVLILGEIMLALILNVLLESYWSDPHNPLDDREEVYAYFGTFTKAILTLIEMLLGNWYTITRMLASKVSEWYMVLGITHQLVVGFAVIEVITGVFLHETFKVASLDDGILMNETQREVKDQSQKMLRFFKYADVDSSGELDREEFRQVLARDKVQEWMNAQGLDVHNIDRVFTLIDQDKNGLISPEELITGALNLKGQARAMELAIVRAMVEDIHYALRLKTKNRAGLYNRPATSASEVNRGRSRCSTGMAWSPCQESRHDSAELPGIVDS